MTFGSLFAGIGGFDLGLERAGMTCKWQVEIDPFCLKVLTKHWPDVPKFKDVHDCGKHNLEPVDLICGGWPCQPFSVAGKRRGKADDRYLWPEVSRIMREMRPTWFLGENVPGIIRMELDEVLSDLESQGYETATFVIPACAVDAPHRRERVWIVAHSNHINSNRRGCKRSNPKTTRSCHRITRPSEYPANVADTECNGLEGRKHEERRQGTIRVQGRPSDEDTKRNDANANSEPTGWSAISRQEHYLWLPEPDVGRVAHGVPSRVDRLRSLGNAVVPQVVEFIGRRILEHERKSSI